MRNHHSTTKSNATNFTVVNHLLDGQQSMKALNKGVFLTKQCLKNSGDF